MSAMKWPGPDATKAEIDAFVRENAPKPEPVEAPYGLASNGQPHEAPAVENGPSIVCTVCEVVRIPMTTAFCKKCKVWTNEVARKLS